MKKTFIAIALMAAACANAGTIFTGTAKGGNTVNLNDTKSNYCRSLDSESTKWNYAESVDRDGMVAIKGCWASWDDKVVIHWLINGERVTANWSLAAFRETAYFRANYKDTTARGGEQL